MVRAIDIMKLREEEVGNLIELLSSKSRGFTKPKLILIGGYALRAYVPFSRYTRDCDFVLKRRDGWHIDVIEDWLPTEFEIESFEKRKDYGFLRCIKFFEFGKKKVKISMDFMEGMVVGRTEGQVVSIDEKFIGDSKKVEIFICKRGYKVYVPNYTDYLILKIVSARPSDVRDIATLVWKKGVPRGVKKRMKEILPRPEIFRNNLEEIIIPDMANKRFVNSWRGTFVTTEFTEEIKGKILEEIRSLV